MLVCVGIFIFVNFGSFNVVRVSAQKVSQAYGVQLMVTHLGVTQTVAGKNCKDEYGAYVSYKTLKTYYEDHLYAATRLRVRRLWSMYKRGIGVGLLV